MGAKNYAPMSYNPDTGLLYINAIEASMNYTPLRVSGWRRGTLYLDAELSFILPEGNVGFLRAVDPLTGDVWSNEHGPRGGDELNLILPGRNYGWSVVSHGINYDGTVFSRESERPGMESPRFVWVPSIGTSGMMIYAGDR